MGLGNVTLTRRLGKGALAALVREWCPNQSTDSLSRGTDSATVGLHINQSNGSVIKHCIINIILITLLKKGKFVLFNDASRAH